MRPTDLELELYIVGDLSREQSARIESLAKEDAQLEEYIQRRRAEQRAFAISRPRLTFNAPACEALASTPARWRALWRSAWQNAWAPIGAVASAAVVALFVFTPAPAPEQNSGDDNLGSTASEVRARGEGFTARLIARRHDVVFFVNEKTPLRPGDQVRIEISSEQRRNCCAVGVDTKGRTSILYDGEKVEIGRSVFPRSLTLDDSVGREKIVIACGVSAAALEDSIALSFAEHGSTKRALGKISASTVIVEFDKEAAAPLEKQ